MTKFTRRIVCAVFLLFAATASPTQIFASRNRNEFRPSASPMLGLDFAPVVDYGSGGNYAYSVAVSDVNGDGKPDLVVTNFCADIPNCHGTVGVLLGNGDGTFQAAVTYGSGGFWAYSVTVADVNGDRKPDLLVGNLCPSNGNCNNGVVGVLLGNGDGTFQAAVSYGSGGYTSECCGSYSLAVADVNGDGKPDLLFANDCVSSSNCSNGTVGILLGNGDGTFQPVVAYGSGGYDARSVAVSDLNADGKLDLLVANVCASSNNCNGGMVSVLLGNGDGTFQTAVTYASGGGQANSVAVADVNGDGKPDLLVANACGNTGPCEGQDGGSLGVLLGNGNGTFQSATSYGSGGYDATSVAIADLNADGKPDLVVANDCASNVGSCNGLVGVLLGNGDGSFQPAVTYSSGGSGSGWVAVADVNGRGRPDLLVANQCAISNCTGDASVGVFINIGSQSAFRTLLDFMGPDGGFPLGSVIQGLDGNLYGTTSFSDGSQQGGTVFKVNKKGSMTVLYNFCSQTNCIDGKTARAGLALASTGFFYGTTSAGGVHNTGTVFQITSKGTLTTLYNFCSQPNCTDGAAPDGAVVQAIDGNLYGTTLEGGANNAGTIFRISTKGALTTLYNFCSLPNCTDGAAPEGAMLQATDGNLYGTTSGGGVNSSGTVFKISTDGTLTTLYRFGGTDGYQPVSGLVQATDGNFYGTTDSGGASNSNCPLGCGTVFRITSEGKLTTLYNFCAQTGCSDGLSPQAALIQATDGTLYGTTSGGGNMMTYCPNGCGTLFTITLGGALTSLYSFCARANCADGYFPMSALTQSTNGAFYGTTYESDAAGTVFSLDTGLSPFVTFVRAAGRVGQTGPILGQGLAGTTSITINGIPATFSVVSDTFIRATVPIGATTGYVTVSTPTGILTSNVPFHVIP
jgi:uncharacterized repeat protein (TIGR03803 family)